MTMFKGLLCIPFLVTVFLFSGCGGDDEPMAVPPPRAIFEFEVNSENNGEVMFTSISIDATSYLWDFGDGVGTSTEENPTYTYLNSGRYTVQLTVTNESGENSTTLDVSVATNIVDGGDMSSESPWTLRQVWTDPDNAVAHAFSNGAFMWDNEEGTSYSQSYLYQEVAVEAGKTYRFNAEVASEGTKDIWFEVYFGNADPAEDGDYSSNGLRLYISSFDDPVSGCANDMFDGSLLDVAQGCTPDPAETKILPADGTFTLSAEELTANGSIYLVFKSGSWDSAENYKEGITLDNVSIVEVL